MNHGPPATKLIGICVAGLVAAVPALAASEAAEPSAIIHQMTYLVLQLGVILIAARLGGDLARRVSLPSVIGELVAGIIIGPYLLGGLGFPLFEHGLFPLVEGQSVPVRPELYGIATIASVLLLFNAGLETDLSMLFRFSVAGAVVGAGGVVASFAAGAWVTAAVTGTAVSSPLCLFMGAIATATSVGVTARILHDTRSTDKPEGVTILAGAVIDDVIGIIVLAIVIGLSTARNAPAHHGVAWGEIGAIALKAVGVWLGATAVGLLLARRIAGLLKRFGAITAFTLVALGMCFLVSGLFERAGLAMVIGAYVTGLVLSRTDVRYVIEEELHGLSAFFVPVFFAVTGMFVNVHVLFTPAVLGLGLAYALACLLAKLIGCGGPALLVGFNRLGAARIGLGMAPRSEVALIIASTGLSYHVLTDEAFGATIVMVLLSVLLTPPLLARALRVKQRGTRAEVPPAERSALVFNFPTRDLAELLCGKVVEYFRDEGFFVHMVADEHVVYHVTRERTHVALTLTPSSLMFDMASEDVALVRTVVYEALLNLHETIGTLKHAARPEAMRREIAADMSAARKGPLGKVFHPTCVTTHLNGTTKQEIIQELVDMLTRGGRVSDRREALEAVMAREQAMSTGMQDGIALPHARTNAVGDITVAVGLKPEGADFQSIDGKPSTIFVLVLSPRDSAGPHIRFLADVAARLNNDRARAALLASRTPRDIVAFFDS